VAVVVRTATPADEEQIARVRRESWFAAYEGIVDAEIIDRVTAPRAQQEPPPWRTTVVAEADGTVVGYAAFGPEREVVGSPYPHPLSEAGLAGETGELYAIYVSPGWWSTGTGRELASHAFGALRQAGYARIVLWVLADNARARRFYERGGLRGDGATNVLHGLGGVLELRYFLDL
jgi:ribosomal protein S18 acetylase RimI-like enzyme